MEPQESRFTRQTFQAMHILALFLTAVMDVAKSSNRSERLGDVQMP